MEPILCRSRSGGRNARTAGPPSSDGRVFQAHPGPRPSRPARPRRWARGAMARCRPRGPRLRALKSGALLVAAASWPAPPARASRSAGRLAGPDAPTTAGMRPRRPSGRCPGWEPRPRGCPPDRDRNRRRRPRPCLADPEPGTGRRTRRGPRCRRGRRGRAPGAGGARPTEPTAPPAAEVEDESRLLARAFDTFAAKATPTAALAALDERHRRFGGGALASGGGARARRSAAAARA